MAWQIHTHTTCGEKSKSWAEFLWITWRVVNDGNTFDFLSCIDLKSTVEKTEIVDGCSRPLMMYGVMRNSSGAIICTTGVLCIDATTIGDECRGG